MISFKEYHKQMEILNESKNKEHDIQRWISEKNDEKLTLMITNAIDNNDNDILSLILKKSNSIKNEFPEDKFPDLNKELSKVIKNNNRNENYEKTKEEILKAASIEELNEIDPEKALKTFGNMNDEWKKELNEIISKKEKELGINSEEKNSPKTEDVETDINYLFREKEKIQNLINNYQTKKVKNFTELDEDLLFYCIIENVIRNKMIPFTEKIDNINKSVVDILDVPIYKLKKKPGYKIGEEKNQKAESIAIINNFLNMLGELHDIKAGPGRPINGIIDNYCKNNNLYEKDINSPAVQKQIKDDIKNGDITKKANSKLSPDETIDPIGHNKKKTIINGNGNSDGNGNSSGSNSKTPELSDSAKAGRKVASDPNNVNSLTMNSDDTAIQTAIDGTFGTEDPSTPGDFFIAAIEKAKKGRERIAKDVEADNKYINSVTDRKKELNSSIVVHENVLLKELQNNPLLKEEYEILQEKLFGPEGERTNTRWSKKLGKDDDGSSGDLSDYRLKKRNEAIKAFGKIKNKYVGNSTRADAVNKIQKIGNEYMSGLNQRVNSLIKKGDYGPITSLIRDVKIANADRITKKNENYAATGKGKSREAMEDAILKRLEEWNNNIAHVKNKKTTEKQIRKILSTWAMAKQSTLDLFAPKDKVQEIENLLGGRKLEEGKKIIDNFIDFGKTEINPGIDIFTYNHIKTLLSSGKYDKLVNFATGTNIANKINNLVRDSYNANRQEDNKSNNSYNEKNNQRTSPNIDNKDDKSQGESTTASDKEEAVQKNVGFLGNILKGVSNISNKLLTKYLDHKKKGTDFFSNDINGGVPSSQDQGEASRKAVNSNTSVVTEEVILTEDGQPISKSGAEEAVLKALSLNAQEAAEGKQWIIDNIYKGNPLASQIVDKFVEENSNKRAQAAKALAAKKQAVVPQSVPQSVPQPTAPAAQSAPAGTPQQVATAMKSTNQPVANQQANTQQANTQQQPQQNKPVNATVTTAAADGFPNRLYKKIIRRKIGF